MKKILLFSIFALAMMKVMAAPVDVATAKSTAQQFLREQVANSLHRAPANSQLELVLTERSMANVGQALYYIFNTNDSYLIVSGDDRAREILAYGDSPIDVNNIPTNMKVWLEGYKGQLEYLLAHPGVIVEKTSRKAPAANGNSVQPLLASLWDQGEPYNRHCPPHRGMLSVTGCAATSLAMVFHYWKYPTEPTPTVPGYTTASLHLALEQLPSITFDWDNMLNRYRGNYSTEQAEAVAWLMRYIGQSERMDYNPNGSGTYGDNILETVKRFGYDQDARLVYKESWSGQTIYNDDEWAAIIQEELTSSRPIVMCAYTATMSGHAFNVDGYDAHNDTYHVNWGWSGQSNAYFALNAFNGGGSTFNVGQQLIIGIEPPATVPTIKASLSRLSPKAYVDSTATTTFNVRSALLTDDITLTLEDNSGYFELNTNEISLNTLAQYNQVPVRVKYKPKAVGSHTAKIILRSTGAQDKVINLQGTCVLETYDPVMLAASDVTMSSFTAHWQDATPAHNVVSYNLEIATVPFHELSLTESFDNNEYSGTSSSDWSSKLDEITSTPGWTGSKVYRSYNNILLGNANSKGWIQTPVLDTYGNNDLITVAVRARSTGNQESTPLIISCGSSSTTIYISNEEKEHIVLLPCPSGNGSRVKLSSVAGQRVMLCNVEVYAGDNYTPVDLSTATYLNGISSTSYEFKDMNCGYYGMRVQAVYTDGTTSPWSNRTRVMVEWKKGDVNHDGEINIADVNEVLNVVLKGINSPRAISINDVNNDGEINIADIDAIIKKILE